MDPKSETLNLRPYTLTERTQVLHLSGRAKQQSRLLHVSSYATPCMCPPYDMHVSSSSCRCYTHQDVPNSSHVLPQPLAQLLRSQVTACRVLLNPKPLDPRP
jgi:hypothetical protein